MQKIDKNCFRLSTVEFKKENLKEPNRALLVFVRILKSITYIYSLCI